MFKVKKNVAQEIMKELFAPKMSPYDLRNNNSFNPNLDGLFRGSF